MPQFEFATSQRIVFGVGVFEQLGALAEEQGRQVFLVASQSATAPGGPVGRLVNQVRKAGLSLTVHPVSGEPDTASVGAATEAARRAGADVVVGLGGGSALDTAKAVAGLLTNGGAALDYMEGVGRGQTIRQPTTPLIAVPTTAGPGTEVTRNAVILSRAHGVKASIRSPLLLPRVALVDPALTLSLPPEPTASTGLDALTQLIEPYVSRRANPLTDALVMGALGRGARALPATWANGANLDARTSMAFASLCGGLALANAGLGAAHGLAAPLGGQLPIPHGVACAVLLAPVMAANVAALRALPPDAPAGHGTAGETLQRYAHIGTALTGVAGEDAVEAGIGWAAERVAEFKLPGLSHYGLTAEQIPHLARLAAQASSMKANPIALPPTVLEEVLRAAL
ncbi:MAG: iron-containing alcohol dehydrogenase [Anaerolineae bacterium]|nr:iron-containing alcohol dehydrogenase [Anaerolineae bacterium]